jgi:hypothetical protein
MPRETIAIILVIGLGLGLLWGSISLELWTLNEGISPILIAPLWLTVQVASRLPVDPLLAGFATSAAIGLTAAFAFLALARLRAW